MGFFGRLGSRPRPSQATRLDRAAEDVSEAQPASTIDRARATIIREQSIVLTRILR
jgi:hypothetical protein